MKRRILNSPRARLVGLALSVGVIGSLAMSATAMADNPPAGVACRASDGKIFGRGSTFQINAVNKGFADGYEQDVCGPAGNAGNLNSAYVQYSPFTGTATGRGNADPALNTLLGDTTTANNMVAYDSIQQGQPPGAGADPNYTGSGQGIIGTGCRDSAFGGTDVPYNTSQLDTEDNTPTAISTATGFTPCSQSKNGAGTEVTINPPYPPDSGTYPNTTSDGQASLMTIPVSGGALAVVVHFGTGTSGCPATLQLAGLDLSKIMDGNTFTTWNQLSGLDGNPTFNCLNTTTSSPLAITRVVRSDGSGSTQTIKNYLRDIDGSRTLACTTAPNNTWTALAKTNSNNWPSGSPCTTVNAQSGTGAVVSTTQATAGAIGYGDLSAWPTTAEFVSLRNATNTAYVSPGTPGAKSNCNLGAKGLPGSTPDDAVGLNGAPTPTTSSATWATDATTLVSDINNIGSGFPLCALTWDMVYPESGTSLFANGTPAIAALTADQIRTLYSYYTYVLSPAAQARMNSLGYDSLPVAWESTLLTGFQNDF